MASEYYHSDKTAQAKARPQDSQAEVSSQPHFYSLIDRIGYQLNNLTENRIRVYGSINKLSQFPETKATASDSIRPEPYDLKNKLEYILDYLQNENNFLNDYNNTLQSLI